MKFIVCNHIRISKCKNIFLQNYTPNWTKEVFEIKSVKDKSPWTDLKILTVKLLEHFINKNLKKLNCKNQGVI